MATLPARTTLPLYSFSTRSGLGMGTPPVPPPGKPQFGSYCFKATCDVTEEDSEHPGCPISRGRVTGYDKHVGVGKDTEYACAAYFRSQGKKGYKCGEAQVVMLMRPGVGPPECSGQIYWTIEDRTRRLL